MTTTSNSLESKSYVMDNALKIKNEIQKIKLLDISHETKMSLLSSLRQEFKNKHFSEEHKTHLKRVGEDTHVFRKYGESKKGGKLTREEFDKEKKAFYGIDFGFNAKEIKINGLFEDFVKRCKAVLIIDSSMRLSAGKIIPSLEELNKITNEEQRLLEKQKYVNLLKMELKVHNLL